MTLEDFFTLAEMKDGLTAPSRVQELVSVMQKEKDCMLKSAGDATRQWAAVASTIAATENKDCLDLFIQLDGLWFINTWLQVAQTFCVDASDCLIEESITAILRAIEKLCLDSEKSTSSGICITVSNLLDHHSSRVKDRARVLFETWKGGGNGDAESHDIELSKVDNASDKTEREEDRPSAGNEAGSDNDNDHGSGLVGSEKSVLRSSDNLPPQRIGTLQVQSSDDVPHSSVGMDCESIKDRSPNHVASVLSSAKEVTPINEPLNTASETTSVETCNLPLPKQGSFDRHQDVVKLSDLSKKEEQDPTVNDPPEKLGRLEIFESSKPESGPMSVGASEAKAQESVTEPTLEHHLGNNVDGDCHKIVASRSMRSPMSDRKSGADDTRPAEIADDCCSNALQDSSVSVNNLGKTEALEMSISRTERVVTEGKGHFSNEVEDASNCSGFSQPGKASASPNIVDKKGSENDLEYGIDDALEVARQVAQEVEREVCSSSEKFSERRIRQPGSPDSVKKDELTHVTPVEVSSRQSHSAEACSEEERHASISDNIEAEPECRPNVESLQVTEFVRESGGNSEKHLCAFDLNEAGSDDLDVSVNAMSSPIPVVSASKPAPSLGLPGALLQFEGTLGWKGSAATSAFRPASPRKNYDNDRNLSVDGISDISKQRQDFLDIDLNVAEGEEGLVKPMADSRLPSGQSSMELSPKRSRRLELDLNSTGDDGDVQPLHPRMEGHLFLGRNGYWSPSPASSSSSVQPSVRNIDLNDNPCLQTDLVDQGPTKSSYGFSKSDAPVISILGAKVEVGKKEYIPQTSSLPNGKAIEHAIDLTVSRAGGALGMAPSVSYNHSAVFGYNGVASAPSLPFSSALYSSGGTVPYMMDSRGAPVVPQVGGSSSNVLSSYSQPPFVMSMTATQLGLNGVGPSRPNLDLNSGFMIEGANRDALLARQFFFPGQGRHMEEQVRTLPQPSSSGVGGKRKEPDSGWESYPFSYKHPQPPWK